MSKSNKKSLRDSLHQDIGRDTDENLSNEINNIFINVMRNYTSLSKDIAVSVNDKEVPVFVSESIVAKKLREISTSRSSGPDDIPYWVLKTFSDILAFPVADIINTSFQSCKVPQIWKMADVVP